MPVELDPKMRVNYLCLAVFISLTSTRRETDHLVGFRFVVVTAEQTAEAAEAACETLRTRLRACRQPELMDPCCGSPQGELHFQCLKKEHLIGSKGSA